MVPTTHPAAIAAWRSVLRDLFAAVFAPRPHLHIDEWADRYRRLTSTQGNAPEPGPWSTDRVPYLREILRTFMDPEIRVIVIMKAAQIAFTEGVIGNIIGYHIHQRPRSMVVVQPSNEDARDWSKDKLEGLLTGTPVVAERIEAGRSEGGRDRSTVLTKQFRGGQLKVVGGTSPKGLRRTSAPIILIDEADGMLRSVGQQKTQREGNPIDIVLKRMSAFWDATAVVGSTPTNKGYSHIEEWLARSDWRELHVPCPHCEHKQVLRWGGKDEPYGLKFEWEQVYGRRQVVPGSVAYLCEKCATLIDESDRHWMGAQGEWRALQPEIRGIAGFHIGGLNSPFEGSSWSVIAQEFLDAGKDPDKLQVWTNTRLGELWEEPEEKVDAASLEGRAEAYEADVPAGAGLLTAAVDVQGAGWLEVAVDGWGEGEESWLIDHQRLYGDPEKPEVWWRLEALLAKSWRHESGAMLRIQATMIDARFLTETVYGFVKGREIRRVYAGLGTDSGRARGEPLKRSPKRNRYGVRPWRINPDPFKDRLFRRLRIQKPGPGYLHFCPPTESGADAEYYAQFGAEVLVNQRLRGRLVRGYKQVRARNEAIDLKVLSMAALYSLGRNTIEQLGAMADELNAARRRGETKAAVAAPAGRRVRSTGIRA